MSDTEPKIDWSASCYTVWSRGFTERCTQMPFDEWGQVRDDMEAIRSDYFSNPINPLASMQEIFEAGFKAANDRHFELFATEEDDE